MPARRPAPPPPSLGARPFVKWVGGKRQLLPQLLAAAPARYGTYFEPFVGGGALFFALRPERAVLSDMNERLVRTYLGVRDEVEGLIDRLSTYPYDKDFFLKLRVEAIDARPNVEVAAWFIYLNKAGFNGLYRVNSGNVFNVPFGRYVNPTLCDAENLRACAAALAGADLRRAPFEAVLTEAKAGDFLYFDPPYVPLSVSSSFTSYTADGFGMEDQRRLRDVALALKERGAHVLLSNSSAPAVLELYAEPKGAFEVELVSASRAVSCKPDGRGKIHEVLIR